jgi:hypothetical protein
VAGTVVEAVAGTEVASAVAGTVVVAVVAVVVTAVLAAVGIEAAALPFLLVGFLPVVQRSWWVLRAIRLLQLSPLHTLWLWEKGAPDLGTRGRP